VCPIWRCVRAFPRKSPFSGQAAIKEMALGQIACFLHGASAAPKGEAGTCSNSIQYIIILRENCAHASPFSALQRERESKEPLCGAGCCHPHSRVLKCEMGHTTLVLRVIYVYTRRLELGSALAWLVPPLVGWLVG
jgi:hypothetical protein